MLVINAQNVNDAWPQALKLMTEQGVARETRNGPASVLRSPVTTVYVNPVERVLLDPVRDHNPLFAVFESLWMLAGRDDATYLDQFVSDFSSRFAENDGVQHGAYGKRWRDHFTHGAEDERYTFDQLDEIVRLLSDNPADRQAVLQMWDPSVDLGVPDLKDRPCNTTIYFRLDFGQLDMTVCCRSNDLVLGALGANCVHMSFLLERMAAHIGVPVGVYRQMSGNLHQYRSTDSKCDYESAVHSAQQPYPGTLPLVTDPASFDNELHEFLHSPTSVEPYTNTFFSDTARPMWLVNTYRREKNYPAALLAAAQIAAPDWREATTLWLQRRIK